MQKIIDIATLHRRASERMLQCKDEFADEADHPDTPSMTCNFCRQIIGKINILRQYFESPTPIDIR